MTKRDKLFERLKGKPKDFTWSEACAVMAAAGFELHTRKGSRRMFVHRATGLKVGLHEPHSRPNLLPYEIDALLDGLKGTGQIANE